MWQTYYTPTSVDETLRLLAEHGPESRVIAGGTDLLVELRRGDRQARVLIDVTRVGGLDQIYLDDDGLIHIGPTVTHNQVVASGLLRERGFPLALACWRVGTPQLRNRGTVVGNLVTASPANDTIAALWALDARVTLRSVRGQRSLSFEEFYRGVRATALAADEMVTDVTFPALDDRQRGTFVKLALRRTHAISVVNAAVVLTFEHEGKRALGDQRLHRVPDSFEDDVVTEARITLGSVAPTVIRALEAEALLTGGTLDEKRVSEAADLAARVACPIDDIRAGGDYRRRIARVLVRRALVALQAGIERDEFPAAPPMLRGKTDGRFPRLAGSTICHREGGLEPIECTVNGENVVVQGAGGKRLLDMLRQDLGLIGTKEGCGEGECGACTVWMDGIAVLACLIPAPRAHGTQIVTVEGLAQGVELHPVQQAFIDEGAVQCGYCTPGFVMAGASLLEEIPHPTREQIIAGLTGNLCRCTGYHKIARAIERAA